MGEQNSKLLNPSANIITEIDIGIKTEEITLFLVIIIILLVMQIAITLYQLHKKSIKKYYRRAMSVENQLEKLSLACF